MNNFSLLEGEIYCSFCIDFNLVCNFFYMVNFLHYMLKSAVLLDSLCNADVSHAPEPEVVNGISSALECLLNKFL